MTYYQLLGIHRDSSPHAIKLAYRRWAKLLHPDRNPDVRAHRQMELINEAYRVLSKTELRREYDVELDRMRSAKVQPLRAHTPSSDSDIESQIRELFKRERFSQANRFEGKDSFLGLIFGMIFMMNQPHAFFRHVGNIILVWPFLAVVLIAALLARQVATVYFAWGFKKEAEFWVTVLAHAAAGLVLAFGAAYIEFALDRELFFFPMLPALWAIILPSTVAAGFGRAVGRTFGPLSGAVIGALVGAFAGAALSSLTVLAQVAHLGPESVTNPDVELFIKPARAVIAASALAGGLGSFREAQVFVFRILEYLESWADYILRR